MKRVFTRFVLGGFIAVIVFLLSLPFAAGLLNSYISGPEEKTEERKFIESAINLYVHNQFKSGDSPASVYDELKPYYRPEVLDAIKKGVVDGIRRDDHDDALKSLYLDKFNGLKKKEYDAAKRKDKNTPPPEYYTPEEITEILFRYRRKGLFYYSMCAVLGLCFAVAWIFLHDRFFAIIAQYKKGRLYEITDDENEKNKQHIEQQKKEIAYLKTKLKETETAYSTLDQKCRAFFNQVKEKEKAEIEAKENLKKEAEEKKALKEEAENAFN